MRCSGAYHSGMRTRTPPSRELGQLSGWGAGGGGGGGEVCSYCGRCCASLWLRGAGACLCQGSALDCTSGFAARPPLPHPRCSVGHDLAGAKSTLVRRLCDFPLSMLPFLSESSDSDLMAAMGSSCGAPARRAGPHGPHTHSPRWARSAVDAKATLVWPSRYLPLSVLLLLGKTLIYCHVFVIEYT